MLARLRVGVGGTMKNAQKTGLFIVFYGLFTMKTAQISYLYAILWSFSCCLHIMVCYRLHLYYIYVYFTTTATTLAMLVTIL